MLPEVLDGPLCIEAEAVAAGTLVVAVMDEPFEGANLKDAFGAGVDGGRLAFDYRLREGVSAQRLGMRVLAEEGVLDLLDGSG